MEEGEPHEPHDSPDTGDAADGERHGRLTSLAHRAERLAESKAMAVPTATTKRFFEIDGLDLGGLLAVELFTTVIPLILIGFGWFSHFSSDLSFGDVLIRQLDLSGEKAEQVRSAFGSGASLKSVWTVFGLASFLVWGIPMASVVAKVFARAWRRERFTFLVEVLRGTGWFFLFLATQTAAVVISRLGGRGPPWKPIFNLLGLVPSFVLWSLTPGILIRNGWVGRRYLLLAGLAGVVLDAVLIRLLIRYLLPALLGGWTGFGPIGVAMALFTCCTVFAALWVVTACLGAVLWERNAPEAVVVDAQDGPNRGAAAQVPSSPLR